MTWSTVDRDEVRDHHVWRTGVDVADRDGQWQDVEAVAPAGRCGLPLEALTDDRHRGDAGGLGRDRCPQHGGRTAASTTHPRHHGIDVAETEFFTESTDSFLLVGAVQVAELVWSTISIPGEPGDQLVCEHGEQFVAAEQVVPEEGHPCPFQRLQTVGLALLLDAPRGARPHDVVRWFHAAILPASFGQARLESPRPVMLVGFRQPGPTQRATPITLTLIEQDRRSGPPASPVPSLSRPVGVSKGRRDNQSNRHASPRLTPAAGHHAEIEGEPSR